MIVCNEDTNDNFLNKIAFLKAFDGKNLVTDCFIFVS